MKEYFATLPTSEVAPRLMKKVEEFYEYLRRVGRITLYRRMYDMYFTASQTGGRLHNTGEQGEYTNVDVSDLRNIIQHLLVMTTNQRPSFEPRATNTDYKSQAQTILASGLLDYYLREKKLDTHTKKAVEYCLCYAEGYLGLDWNATIGDEYAAGEDGKLIREGDIEAATFSPLDVPIDFTRYEASQHNWWITRNFANKYVLAAKWAGGDDDEARQAKEDIENLSISTDMKETVFSYQLTEDTDLIPSYTFYHVRNEAVPEGRLTHFLNSNLILSDGPLPFKDVPLYRIAAAEQHGTPFGYTVGFDLMPLQEALDKLYSTVTTNQANFGVQNVAVPRGHNISIIEIIDGLNLIEYDPTIGKPEPLNLVQTAPEIFKFIEMIENKMQTISGVNSVARGNPEASLKSGAALALVQSMAIQFNSGLQHSYAQLMEDVGTGLINILKEYATTKRVSSIAGKANRPLMKEWQGSDLSEINRVTVDLGNPLSRTTAGKVNMAEALMGANMIETPDQYIQVLTTGRLEPIIEGKQAELMNIKSENEMMAEGRTPQAVVTDNHALHVMEHKVVLSSPEARENPEIVEAVTVHMNEHIDLLKNADPILLSLMGQTPVPPELPPPPGGNGKTPELAGSEIAAEGEELPGMPNMPKNPLTDIPFDPETGGL